MPSALFFVFEDTGISEVKPRSQLTGKMRHAKIFEESRVMVSISNILIASHLLRDSRCHLLVL
jgi:hypothetical protein